MRRNLLAVFLMSGICLGAMGAWATHKGGGKPKDKAVEPVKVHHHESCYKDLHASFNSCVVGECYDCFLNGTRNGKEFVVSMEQGKVNKVCIPK